MPSPTPLYQIEECPDLYVDACVCDEQRNLVFLSAWGRDTVTQEFLARLWAGKRVARQNFSGQTPQNLSFTPRARAGRDLPAFSICAPARCFNPRARAGRDRPLITY